MPSERITWFVRGTIRIVVRNTVGFVTAGAIYALVPVDDKIEKVKVTIGASVIGALVSETAANYAVDKFDEAISSIMKIKEEVERQTAEK